MAHLRTSDGARIYHEEHGSGPPLILCYGIGGNTDMWDVNVAALAERHRVILWSPRGHPGSDSPADPARYSLARWALDLRDLLDGLRIEAASVGGHSLGGGIATRFALLHPRRVRSLVITDSSSAAGTPMSPETLVMWARSIEVVARKGIDAVARFQLRHNPNLRAFVRLNPAGRREILGRFSRLDPIGFENSLRALLSCDSHAAELRGLRHPVLLLAGDEDPSLAPMRAMRRLVARSQLVVLSPATHFANREQPAAWNQAVLAFLERAERPARRSTRARSVASSRTGRRLARS